ncbi:MAG: hypothetical protein U9R39_09765 [Campylobacterota bacterium]|nr:hypothetical protein [Campylobacterota bacterium]
MLKVMLKNSISALLLCSVLNADKVQLSTDNMGDFLIAPLYIAKGDICSEVKIFNTNETSSILAKVAFREHISSHEVDFPIFLSPGDVWVGKVCQTESGSVCLTSTDDSNHPSAMQTLKYGQNLKSHSSDATYRHADMSKGYVEIEGKSYAIQEFQKENIDFTKGYIEVFPIAQFYEGTTKKVNKNILVERWDSLERGDLSIKNLSKYGVDSKSLSGLVSFETSNQETSSIPMTAFKGAHDVQLTGSAISYNSDASTEILLGKNKKIAILKLLQKGNVSFTYNDAGVDQYIHILFPFSHKEKQTRRYKLIIRDLEENKYTMIFSPIPKMSNEISMFCIEDLVSLTRDTIKFNEGMIQIKEITNNDTVQLGKNKIASILPTLSRIKTIGNKSMVINTIYIPVK